MLFEKLRNYTVILASKSPRRQQLLRDLGIDFEVQVHEVEETYPENLTVGQIPVYLAGLKAQPFINELTPDTLLITSDTIVSLQEQVLGKPCDYNHAFETLKALSGQQHQVITGVCITTADKSSSFASTTNVWFKTLSDGEIHHYIKTCKPYDKAGAYGIQEWIGYIGIEKIEGSYFNVMGLPVQRLYEELDNFLS